MSNLKVVEEFFQTVWSRGDVVAAQSFFNPGASATGLGSDMVFDPADFVTFAQFVLRLIGNPDMEVLHAVEDGEWISLHLRCRAISKISGAKIDFTGQLMARVVDDKIAEAYNHFDIVAFLVQMEFMPDDMMEKILAGYAVG